MLILIDGSSYFYRAFHALPPLSNSKGQPTGAVYGVVNMIRKLIKDHQPEWIGVVFDARGKTFRDDLYADYKATRTAIPDDLSIQFDPMIEILEAMGLKILTIPGVEADDVIGTLAKQATEQGITTLISTGDKDMAQLVNSNITLINTMSNSLLDEAKVKEKFGVKPNQIVDYLTLIGDKVDNVPGVDKVGPKTAAKWLESYGTLDKLIEHSAEIPGKIGENLRAALNHLPLSKQLVTIKTDCELPLSPLQLTTELPDREKLIGLYRELEFKSWLDELLKQAPVVPSHEYQTLFSLQELDEWIAKLQEAKLFALDIQTTDVDYMKAKLVGLSFSLQSGVAAYVPFRHDYPGAPEQLTEALVLEKLKPILQDPKLKKVGQYLKYDMNVLRANGIELQGVAFDSMLESYVLNSAASRHDLDSLALKYLGCGTIHLEDIAGKGAKKVNFNHIDIAKASIYAAEQADLTLRLHQQLWPKIAEESGLKNVFETIELPLISVLSRMETTGVLIDAEALRQQSARLAKRIQELEVETFAAAGQPFNMGSPKQLQEILFEKLKHPITRKTPTGQPSTAEDVLQELAHDYPVPKLILEYRTLSKLKSTYTDKLPEQINPNTGRVHTCYNQAVTSTGRLSSTDPNLQNIPVRNEQGREIRKAFIASPGCKIISADYSQIELRIMAHLSEDEGLLNAFSLGLDIHTATAAEVLGVALDQVTHDQRRSAKAINFGLLYGMSAFGLARQLGSSRETAEVYIHKYFKRYPGVKHYMDSTRVKAHANGFVETLFGRRLYLAEIHTQNAQRRKAAERAAINAPLQGTAADLIKMAMISLDRILQKPEWQSRMIMQVHDELVFEAPVAECESLCQIIKQEMVHVAELKVPIEVDIGIGMNWDEAH